MRPFRRTRFVFAGFLISLSLLWITRFALEMALFPVPVELKPGVYDTLNLDERQFGWTQFCLVLIVGIVVWIPFRRAELWAWLSIWLFLILYGVPVVIYPLTFTSAYTIWSGAVIFLPAVLGLLLVLPDIVRKLLRDVPTR